MLFAIGMPGARVRYFLDTFSADDATAQLDAGEVAIPLDRETRGTISSDGTSVLPD